MWNEFTETLRAQLSNQLVAGAIALGLVGVAAAALRKVPGALWSQLKRAFVVTAMVGEGFTRASVSDKKAMFGGSGWLFAISSRRS